MKEEKSKSELEERNIDWLYRIHKDIIKTQEMLTARHEGEKTSRLTSLYNKI